MAYYRKHVEYAEIAPLIQNLRLWLRSNCPVVKEYEDGVEAFLVTADRYASIDNQFRNQVFLCQNAGYCQFVPMFGDDETIGILTFSELADGEPQTVSFTHVRLPKLSRLICMTPKDFFTIIKIIYQAKVNQTGNLLMINPPAAGYIDEWEGSFLYPYFVKVRSNYRIAPDRADKKWFLRKNLGTIANLPPTQENQLYAMQYITALLNRDIDFFPAESVINLELDWQQYHDDYCTPQYPEVAV